jgi:tetratricopeptide (TPR) repeat protein
MARWVSAVKNEPDHDMTKRSSGHAGSPQGFPDRRARLFGREADVRYLTGRADTAGVTVLAAAPLMGKTWTLTEVARRLADEGRYLVGYHEAAGQEQSHLLRAVSNLYLRWLSDADMREQAAVVWAREKRNLIIRFGQTFGHLFKALNHIAPGGVAKAVSGAFDKLAEAQHDLLHGGLDLRPLPYDQAIALTQLVAQISGRRIVLMLDGCEGTLSSRGEAEALAAFLKHLEDWPPTHVFLGIRHPDIQWSARSEEAVHRARGLCSISAAAIVRHLGHMDLNPPESSRLVAHLRGVVPATRDVSMPRILELISGYPGVVAFWTTEHACSAMRAEADLREQAANAHDAQYKEFDRLFSGLSPGLCELACRLALFPRLSAETWSDHCRLFVPTRSSTSWHALIDAQVLIDADSPSYGHDTRHEAARRWLSLHKAPLMRQLVNRLICDLVSGISRVDARAFRICEVLGSLSRTARKLGASEPLLALTAAAQALRGDMTAVSSQEFDEMSGRAASISRPASRLIGMSMVNRFTRRMQSGDRANALADCAAVLALPRVPPDVVAFARFNLGVVKEELGDFTGARAEYSKVIAMRDAPANAKAMALLNLSAFSRDNQGNRRAIAQLTAVIRMRGARADLVDKALGGRIKARAKCDKWNEVMRDCTALIERGPEQELVEFALEQRGFAKQHTGDVKGAVADYTELLGLENISSLTRACARYSRGLARLRLSRIDAANDDFAHVLDEPDAPAVCRAGALYNLATSEWERGNAEKALVTFAEAANVRDLPGKMLAMIRLSLALRTGLSGDWAGTIARLTAVIEGLPEVPKARREQALTLRAGARVMTGNVAAAFVDCTSVIESPGACSDAVINALKLRGDLRAAAGDLGGVGDYVAILRRCGLSRNEIVSGVRAEMARIRSSKRASHPRSRTSRSG